MANIEMTLREYASRIARSRAKPEFKALMGTPVPQVARHLGVSRQRVAQLIDQGKLQAIDLVASNGGRNILRLVTDESLHRYRPALFADDGPLEFFEGLPQGKQSGKTVVKEGSPTRLLPE